MPDYDGEIINPFYGRISDEPGFTQEKLDKAHATYCGEITMVDTWIGQLLRKVENVGIADKTTIIFTSDHGFYFGEHGGMFGKANMAKRDDGSLYRHGDKDAPWGFSPLYEDVVTIPLLIHSPGSQPGSYSGLTSAVDVMPTVLETFGIATPDRIEGRSLLPAINNENAPGRAITVSSAPFANPLDRVRSVDDISRPLGAWPVTTITSDTHSLLYTPEPGLSQLFDLVKDPRQEKNIVKDQTDIAVSLHNQFVEFMRETKVASNLLEPRLQLKV
jgi:arylsulfatase A-like enzyme